MASKTLLIFLFISVLHYSTGAKNTQEEQSRKRLCNSLQTFCAQCEQQTRNCNRLNKECASVLKTEGSGTNKGAPSMQLVLCRQVRSQCNLCKNQGNRCKNLKQQCQRNTNNNNNDSGTKPSTETPSSSVSANNGTPTKHNKRRPTPQDVSYGEIPLVVSQSIGTGGVNRQKKSCQKFGMRCQNNLRCCHGLKCSGNEDGSALETCVMINSKDHSQNLMAELLLKSDKKKKQEQDS